MCWPIRTHGTVQWLSGFAVIVPGELSVEQSLGVHSVGVGHSGQVTVGQGGGGGIVGQVGQITGGEHIGQMVGGRHMGHDCEVGHVPQQLLQAGQDDWELGSAEYRQKYVCERWAIVLVE